MTLSQRTQHILLGVSFVILAITGFALKFPDSWIAKLLGSNEVFRRRTHRIAGVVLLAVGAYHLVYLLATKGGRHLLKDLLPVRKDIKDVADNARYLAGLKRSKPKFARFGYPGLSQIALLLHWAAVLRRINRLASVVICFLSWYRFRIFSCHFRPDRRGLIQRITRWH